MTIKLIDVARAANVSRSTASNVFSNPTRVRVALREKVEAAAKALDYAGPNPKGRILRMGKINALGVVGPAQMGVAESLGNQVFSQFLLGVAQSCDAVGASMVLVPDTPGKRGIGSALVDGFIFGRTEHLSELEPARLRRLPFVVVDFDAGPDVNSVRVDARAGAKAAARHLLELGHRRFAIMSVLRHSGPFISFPPGTDRPPSMAGIQIDQEKLVGYAEAFAQAGLSIDAIPIVQANPSDPDAAGALLEMAPDATAFLSMTVMQGTAIVREAQNRGRKVPQDLSVVGFNDSREAALSHPPLTTIDSLTTEKGRIAAELVLGGEHGKHHVLSPLLMIRGSTAPVTTQ